MKNLKLIFMGLIAPFFLSGCVTAAMMFAYKMDQREAKRQGRQSTYFEKREKQRIAALKDAGLAEGYYLSAVVHAIDKPEKTEENASRVKKMYEEAVEKGSNDAKVVLGNMLIRGGVFPERAEFALSEKEQNVKKGLKMLTEAAEESCFYRKPFDVGPNCKEGYVERLNAPQLVWYFYRDDEYSRKPNGDLYISKPKNPKLEAYWGARMEMCDREIYAFNKKNQCH